MKSETNTNEMDAASILDVGRVIEIYGLDKQIVASHLFPKSKHPMEGLYRLTSGRQVIDILQAGKLASLAGVPLSGLFNTGWDISVNAEGAVTLDVKDFRSTVYSTGQTGVIIVQVSHKDSLFHTTTLHCKSTTLPEIVTYVQSIINNFLKTTKK